MIRRSLRWRLVLFGALALMMALGASAIGLAVLFDRHAERVTIAELEARAFALAAMVEPGEAGQPARLRAAPEDPLYDQPFSGHYWQLSFGEVQRRSRSLWDYRLPEPEPRAVPGSRVLSLPGPQGEPLVVLEQALRVESAGDPVMLRVLVATDRKLLAQVRKGFLTDLLPYLALLGGFLIVASWAQITLGLRPLAEVSARLGALIEGRRRRIGDDLPDEVIALAGEIDRLLDARDQELIRARHRAADLAHGLKTPLQALLGDAGQLRRRGEHEIALSVETIAQAMRRLVDRELVRARLQPDHRNARAVPAHVLRRITDVLRRMPEGRRIDWQLDVPERLEARIDPDDLTEAMGALFENAMRHARSRVEVRAVARKGDIVITLRDDGPGVPPEALDDLIRRGVRLDEDRSGQGIGLAIVSDIVEAARGTLTLRNAAPGLEIEIRLPAAPPPAAG